MHRNVHKNCKPYLDCIRCGKAYIPLECKVNKSSMPKFRLRRGGGGGGHCHWRLYQMTIGKKNSKNIIN